MAYETWRFNAALKNGSPVIFILGRINPILILAHISLRSILILSTYLHVDLPVRILKELLSSFVLNIRPAHLRFNISDYIRWTVQTMKFLILKPSSIVTIGVLPLICDQQNVEASMGYSTWQNNGKKTLISSPYVTLHISIFDEISMAKLIFQTKIFL